MPSATIVCAPPQSVNRTTGEAWQLARRRKRRLQAELGMLLLAADLPRPLPGDRAHATAVLYFPTARRRDEGNYRAPLEKALADALQTIGALSDDTAAHFTFGALTFAHDHGKPARCELTLAWGAALDEDAAA